MMGKLDKLSAAEWNSAFGNLDKLKAGEAVMFPERATYPSFRRNLDKLRVGECFSVGEGVLNLSKFPRNLDKLRAVESVVLL